MNLSNTSLEQLNNLNNLITPNYDRSKITCGIMHMSLGGFHRSHQAAYIDKLLKEDNRWGICAVGLMPQDHENIEKLKSQDTLYSVLERNGKKDTLRIIGSITEVIHAPSSPQDVINRLCDSNIKILSLTITEKGYCYDNNKNIDKNNKLIQHDLTNLSAPKTALGFIVAGLKKRKEQRIPPFTVMSCDNLPGNGHLTHKLVIQFATLIDKELAEWIDNSVQFPNSMVDRITPVTTRDIITTIEKDFGIKDAWPVVCEEYIQWVLEDRFCNDRPMFETTGIQIIENVDPYEKMKVRLLNGSHSALSYISYLMGYREVDKAMSAPLISQFVRSYMDHDITPTLSDVPGINLNSYKDTLIERFSNTAISDQVQRLAEDGSQKIPNAIIPCINYQLESNGSTKYLALALAGWFRYLTAIDEQGMAIDIKDPLSEQLIQCAQSNPENPIALLEMKEIFGPHLSKSDKFVAQLRSMLHDMNSNGIKSTLRDVLEN